MALVGLHVVCAYAGSKVFQRNAAPTLGRPIWSETIAAPGTGTKTSPGADTNGDAVFHLRSAADAWVSIGKTPDAANGTRIFVPAGEFVTVYTDAGDKLAWTAA